MMYITYNHRMPKPPPCSAPNTLKVKLGNWFEAQASGWGVAAIPLLLLLLVGVAVFLRLRGG